MKKVLKKFATIRQFKDFAATRDGTAIVEFALLAPILVMVMLGSLTAFDTVRAIRHLTTASNTAADLATRIASMDQNMEQSIMLTAEALLGQYKDRNDHAISITSVANPLDDGKDEFYVVWSVATEEEDKITNSDLNQFQFPSIPNGEAIILVSMEMDHEPLFSVKSFDKKIKFSDVAIRRPRFVNEVCYEVKKDDFFCSDDL